MDKQEHSQKKIYISKWTHMIILEHSWNIFEYSI